MSSVPMEDVYKAMPKIPDPTNFFSLDIFTDTA